MSQRLILMSETEPVDSHYKRILYDLRKTYGNTTQILVSNEELCELAAVCAKFPRYKDPDKARAELRSAAVDEVADVLIILDHVINIFRLKDEEIRKRIDGKLDRIVRWLAESSDQEQTTVDREVREGVNPQLGENPAEKPQRRSVEDPPSSPCSGCIHVGNYQNLKPGHRCSTCATKGFSMKETRRQGEHE